ncbi:hypothetical protein Desmu_0491 [Desulfurococcus mucosus DSM 2162]|uniref:Uncharacterized protein n=2 Tax=Desulfurococcus mucosus TaxID=2275 RepID=E8R8H8_DESM0|nr:hypothetical protein Desmu_0491 [Desulfurococcus mucosus DSM 2162]
MITTKARSDFSDSIIVNDNIIEISLKPRKRMISLRVSEDDLEIIDKFAARNGSVSRTYLLTKLVEAVAEGLRRSNGNVSSIVISFKGGSSETVSIQLNIK